MNTFKAISWFGTFTSIAGAFLMAFGFVKFGYVCFSLGSFSWLIIGVKEKNKPMLVMNGTFFVANIIGLYRAFV